MGAATAEVLKDEGVRITPRKTPVQVKFRWDPELAEELRQIAERTNRSINDVGAMLIKWAIEHSEIVTEEAGSGSGLLLKRKK